MTPDGGEPSVAVAIVSREGVRLLGGWDVIGLVATASCDYEVPAQFVADEFVRIDSTSAT